MARIWNLDDIAVGAIAKELIEALAHDAAVMKQEGDPADAGDRRAHADKGGEGGGGVQHLGHGSPLQVRLLASPESQPATGQSCAGKRGPAPEAGAIRERNFSLSRNGRSRLESRGPRRNWSFRRTDQ